MSSNWATADTEAGQLELMGAASRLVDDGVPGTCPLCKTASLRFYFHLFDRESNRGTIWVWCPNCKKWGHISRVMLESEYADPFTRVRAKEFAAMERGDFISRLNQLWDTEKLPRRLTVES